jgi:uncharacterized protein (TIGR01244 family)
MRAGKVVRAARLLGYNWPPMLKRRLYALALALLLAASAGAQKKEEPDIRNFLRVSEEFCTGGQPRLEHLARLKEGGVRAVINLRRPAEHRAEEEEAEAKRLGLRYFNIPVAFGEPKDEQADEFLKITDDPANRPAFIHCTAAIRAGAFWMIRRALRDNWTTERAEEEAARVGLREAPHLTDWARAYIEKRRKSRD